MTLLEKKKLNRGTCFSLSNPLRACLGQNKITNFQEMNEENLTLLATSLLADVRINVIDRTRSAKFITDHEFICF